jgi:serine protease inhibitor
VEFALEADHDLLATPDIFGLATVSDPTRGHFPGIAEVPLAVGQARQNLMARFNRRGFEAAAVTGFSIRLGAGRPQPKYEIREVTASFTRPFAYYAVHRPTGLILVAGWVAQPAVPDPE